MLDGYMLELVAITQSTPDSSFDAEILQRNIVFQNDLRQVLILLDNESSLDVITQEIILRCVIAAYFIQTWRYVQLAITLPCLTVFLQWW